MLIAEIQLSVFVLAWAWDLNVGVLSRAYNQGLLDRVPFYIISEIDRCKLENADSLKSNRWL